VQHLGFQTDPPGHFNAHLSGRLFVWFEEYEGLAPRVVFYDFDNDEGLSLDLDEWRRAVAWWSSLDGAPPGGGT
jgi:hypothetical protein